MIFVLHLDVTLHDLHLAFDCYVRGSVSCCVVCLSIGGAPHVFNMGFGGVSGWGGGPGIITNHALLALDMLRCMIDLLLRLICSAA